jgi:hypothetical protein
MKVKEIINIVTNPKCSYIFVYKNKKEDWKIQYNHTKGEKLELMSILKGLGEKT